MSLPLRIHLLGNTIVRRADDSPVEGPLWRRAKVRALLACLALQDGGYLHRDVLIDRLWPDLDHRAALHNLDTTVYDLRRSLQPGLMPVAASDYVQRDGPCYFLARGSSHWLDVQAFETGIVQGRQESDRSRAMARYQAGLAYYQGDLLADLGNAISWCWAERERLRDLYLTAHEELAALHEREGQDRTAIDLYQRILSMNPCRENACRQLMQLYLRRGDRSSAAVHYRRLAEAIQRQWDTAPSPETRRLYEAAVHAS
jgi:DNA-binding SARP family transcriptional activator